MYLSSHQGRKKPRTSTSCQPSTLLVIPWHSSPRPAKKTFQNVELNYAPSSCCPPRTSQGRAAAAHTHHTCPPLALGEEASNARRSCSRSRLARVDHALTRPHAGLGLLGGIHWCSCTCVRSVLYFFILKYTSLCCSVYGPNCICCFMALVQFFETRRGISDGRSQRRLLDMCVWGQQKAR